MSTDREQGADQRDRRADERDALADARERRQDDRESDLDGRERRLQREELRAGRSAAGKLELAQRSVASSHDQLGRSQERLDRAHAGLARDRAHDVREQDDVNREVRRTGDVPPSPRVVERWRRLSAGFQARADAVRLDQWDSPAPCAGWTARDVVAHMVGWMPALWFPAVGRPLPDLPDPTTDPAASWAALDLAVQELLEDAPAAQLPTFTRAGTMSLEQLVAMTGLMDVLVHTWDLARATGQDERLDPHEVAAFLPDLEGMPTEMDEAMRLSGHYGPRVDVPPDADPQVRLLALTGRQSAVRDPVEQG
ncbi:MAG: TIGR03086 family protein [Streptomyces sp.]|uniref:TIGR03086 family metal-binding protein n=1 Tax=Streptomyces sp. TaxID=1931 RepID=UPI0025D8E114|nr:TIGR03086 family metal-binding protein [Streptomyces sp.]MBW8801463.1 TIGR03086 family protein [Streptomyces sp.]